MNINSDYSSEQLFHLRYTDADFCDRLKPSSMMSLFLEMAGINADKLGFGYTTLAPQGKAFVISNLYCELEQEILVARPMKFVTWPIKPRLAVFFRDFMGELDGQVCIRATSRWCLLDSKTGAVLPVSALAGQDYGAYPTEHCVEFRDWKVHPVLPVGEPAFSIRIANSEYDHNMHVNNTRYADYCFNVFRVEELKRWKLKSFQISFLKQCREGDELRFYREACGESAFTVTGYVNETPVVSAKIQFGGSL